MSIGDFFKKLYVFFFSNSSSIDVFLIFFLDICLNGCIMIGDIFFFKLD